MVEINRDDLLRIFRLSATMRALFWLVPGIVVTQGLLGLALSSLPIVGLCAAGILGYLVGRGRPDSPSGSAWRPARRTPTSARIALLRQWAHQRSVLLGAAAVAGVSAVVAVVVSPHTVAGSVIMAVAELAFCAVIGVLHRDPLAWQRRSQGPSQMDLQKLSWREITWQAAEITVEQPQTQAAWEAVVAATRRRRALGSLVLLSAVFVAVAVGLAHPACRWSVFAAACLVAGLFAREWLARRFFRKVIIYWMCRSVEAVAIGENAPVEPTGVAEVAPRESDLASLARMVVHGLMLVCAAAGIAVAASWLDGWWTAVGGVALTVFLGSGGLLAGFAYGGTSRPSSGARP